MSKRKILISILGAITLVLFLLTGFIQHNYVVPILMYHSLNPDARPENRLAVSVDAFKRQMGFLKRCGYNVLSLETVASIVKDKKRLPPRSLALTFDDGYKDTYTYAFPILKKYSFPATFFVIINEIERTDRLSWQEIAVMQESGLISFGSHALGPEPLVNIKSGDELKRQIFDSQRILEGKLGSPVTAFSYPEGRFTPQIKQLVIDAGYKLAVTTSPGKKFANDDVFALKRLRISSTSNNLFTFWIKTSGLYTFIKEHRDED